MTLTGPLVSVIVPTHNRADVIARAIDSVLAQAYEPIELVVVDDGSTDGTRAIVTRYGDQVRYVHQPNRERGAARNAGIAASSGELVSFLDSDDEMLAGHLDALVGALESRPDVSIACCRAEFFDDERGEVFDVIPRRPVEGDAFVDCASGNRMQMGTVLVRRSLLNRVGWFDEDRTLSGLEDWELWTRCLGASDVVFVPDATVRVHLERRNRVRDPAAMERQFRVAAEKITQHPRNRERLARHRHRLRAAMWSLIAHQYLVAGDGRAARARLREGLREDPRIALSPNWLLMAAKASLGASVSGALRDRRRTRHVRRSSSPS